MTTYSTIANSDIDADSPVTTPLLTALRDNPIAITEGSAGAPNIQDAALDTTATTTGRDWVLARTALTTAGAVGSMAFAQPTDTTSYTFGQTIAGSNLAPAGIVDAPTSGGNTQSVHSSGTLSGTWRCMGVTAYNVTTTENSATMWIRTV